MDRLKDNMKPARGAITSTLIGAAIWVMLMLFTVLVSEAARADSPTIFDGDWYSEIGMGYNTSLFQSNDELKWKDGGSPGFYGTLRYELMLDRDRLGLVVHYTHYSNWFAGPPFNDEAESSLDHFGVAVRWKWNK